ncbi:hypothetical protein F0U62_21400 [Cystobacter fuscus]|uniref:hypothetical protein n=1 Tax=Cystobacter fuscus TaxID=43 RepID=UPI002B27E518|nr:hypothetical protein F0U62_21400 [Cystobacter fuscus]
MSVLGAPQVTPDGVFALVRFLSLHEGEVKTEEVVRWITLATGPAAPGSGETLSDRVDTLRTHAAALGFMSDSAWRLTRAAPGGMEEFGDVLHEAFVSAPEQLEVLDTYASMVVELDRAGPDFLKKDVKLIANLLRERVQREDEAGNSGIFNPTRWSPWVRWMTAMGLGFPGPRAIPFLPHPIQRLTRVVRSLPALRDGGEMAAEDFLTSVGRAMPYLDRGVRYRAAWSRAQDTEARRPVSHVLSSALRDLHRRKVLELRFAGGDRAGVRRLSEDGSMPEAFASVRLGSGEVT